MTSPTAQRDPEDEAAFDLRLGVVPPAGDRRAAVPAQPAAPAAALSRATPADATLLLEGALSADTVERLRAQLEDEVAPGRRLALDLSGVTQLSAAALAVLVGAHRRLRDSGGSLVLRAPSPAVVRVLRVSGLHRVMAVDESQPGD